MRSNEGPGEKSERSQVSHRTTSGMCGLGATPHSTAKVSQLLAVTPLSLLSSAPL